MNQLKVPPEKDFADKLHEYFRDVAKTLSGGFINPLIDIILPSFHQKQFENWCNDVYNTLINLENDKLSKVDLKNDLEFISILKESISIASKNHQEEKHKLLRNAIVKSIDSTLNFDIKMFFVRLIDSLSVSHIYLLEQINQNIDKICYLDKFDLIMDNLRTGLSLLKFTDDFFYILFQDLNKFSLIEMSDSIEFKRRIRDEQLITYSEGDEDLPYLRVTEHGKKFLQYIKNE